MSVDGRKGITGRMDATFKKTGTEDASILYRCYITCRTGDDNRPDAKGFQQEKRYKREGIMITVP